MFDFDLTVPLLPREIALKVANAQRATVFLDTIVQVANPAQVSSPLVHATARTLDVALRSQCLLPACTSGTNSGWSGPIYDVCYGISYVFVAVFLVEVPLK